MKMIVTFSISIIPIIILGCNEISKNEKLKEKKKKMENNRVDNSDLDSLMRTLDTSSLELHKIE